MAEFRFDEGKGFAAHCKAFFEAVKADDPEMAAILRDNWDKLVAVVLKAAMDSKARGEFNAEVASVLDDFVLKPPEP